MLYIKLTGAELDKLSDILKDLKEVNKNFNNIIIGNNNQMIIENSYNNENENTENNK